MKGSSHTQPLFTVAQLQDFVVAMIAGVDLSPLFETYLDSLVDTFTTQVEGTSDCGELGVRLDMIEQAWKEIVQQPLEQLFDQAVQKEQIKSHLADETQQHRALVLYFPLCSEREVAQRLSLELRVLLCCRKPLTCFYLHEIWDSCSNEESVVSKYFSYLSIALVQESQFGAYSSLIDVVSAFLSAVKSPYRAMYERRYSNEYALFDQKTSILPIIQIGFMSVYTNLELRDEQLFGTTLLGNERTSPPCTYPGLLGVWKCDLRDASELFFFRLTSQLGRCLAESNLDTELRTPLLSALNSGANFTHPSEFPEIQAIRVRSQMYQSDQLKAQELWVLLDERIADITSDIRIHEEVLEDFMLLDEGHPVAKQKRVAGLEKRIEQLTSGVAQYKLQLDQVADSLREVTHEQEETQDLAMLIGEADDLYVTPHVKELQVQLREYAQNVLSGLVQDTLKAKEKERFASLLFAAQMRIPEHRGLAASNVYKELKASSYRDLVLLGFFERELVDVVEIKRLLDKGQKPKRLKKKFPNELVDVVFYRELLEKHSIDDLQEKHPHQRMLLSLLDAHKALKKMIRTYALRCVRCIKLLEEGVENQCDGEEWTALDRSIIAADCAEIAFECYSQWLAQEYQTIAQNYEQIFYEEGLSFRSWFEEQILHAIGEVSIEHYDMLVMRKPDVAFGLHKLYNLNFRKSAFACPYVRHLGSVFSTIASDIALEDLALYYKRFILTLTSPFAAFLDWERYPLDTLATYLLEFDLEQKMICSTERQKVMLTGWAEYQHLMFHGSERQLGIISHALLEVINDIDPDLFTKLSLAVIDSERQGLAIEQDELFARAQEADFETSKSLQKHATQIGQHRSLLLTIYNQFLQDRSADGSLVVPPMEGK